MAWLSTNSRGARALRGVAFVETLLVVAVLATLWIGVRSLTKLGRARLEVSARARHCAWKMARSGCSVLPPECSVEEQSNTDSNLEAVRRSTPGTAEPAVDRRVDAQLDDLPGTRVHATANRNVAVQRVGGGDGALARATVSLPCAPRAAGPGGLSREIFDSVRGAP